MAVTIGILAVAAYLVLAYFAGNKHITKCFEGADGRPSTSKFQFFVWTGAIIFGYVVFIWARGKPPLQAVPNLPPNLLRAIGFSSATLVGAKGITTFQVNSSASTKVSVVAPATIPPPSVQALPGSVQHQATNWWALLQDDDGVADISKIQMLFFTGIAVVVFIAAVVSSISDTPTSLPDIDGSLMVLMGLSQGAYAGKKLTTIHKPSLTGIRSNSVSRATAPPTPLTITGASLGNGAGSQINFNGALLPCSVSTWADTSITLTLAQTSPLGAGKLTVVVGGVESNAVDLVIAA